MACQNNIFRKRNVCGNVETHIAGRLCFGPRGKSYEVTHQSTGGRYSRNGCHLVSSAEEYDLVINNGRVMDPRRNDSIANVGISAGRIAVITPDKISGKQTIDATGPCGRTRVYRHPLAL